MRREEPGVQEWPLGSGRYRIDYRGADGRRVRKLIGTKKAAIKAYRVAKLELLEVRNAPPKIEKITFSELATMALESKRGRLGPLSYRSDRQRITTMKESLGPSLIDKITTGQIEQLLQELRKTRSGATVNRYHAALSSVFTYAIRQGRVQLNPVSRVPRYKDSDKRERYLEDNEEITLRQVIRELCPEREVEFDLALHTGIRRGQQFSLAWQDVDLERRVLTVRRVEGLSKGGQHSVELNDTAIAALGELHAKSNGSPKVCWPGCYDGCVDWFDDCIEVAGIENFTWHDLRHTFASRSVMAGIDLATVQRWLGHQSILTTMRYAHLAPSHRQAQIQKISGRREGHSPNLKVAKLSK